MEKENSNQEQSQVKFNSAGFARHMQHKLRIRNQLLFGEKKELPKTPETSEHKPETPETKQNWLNWLSWLHAPEL